MTTTNNNYSEFYLEIRDGLVGCFGETKTAKIEKWIRMEREERASTITLKVADQALLEITGWYDEEPHRVLEDCFIGEWRDAAEFWQERAELAFIDLGLNGEQAKMMAAAIDPDKFKQQPLEGYRNGLIRKHSREDNYFCLYGRYWFYRTY